jgi:hypothetical protein
MQGNGLSMEVGNPKKNEDCLAFKAKANQNLDLWPWLSRSEYLEGEFCCQGKCVACTNENSCTFSTSADKPNLI